MGERHYVTVIGLGSVSFEMRNWNGRQLKYKENPLCRYNVDVRLLENGEAVTLNIKEKLNKAYDCGCWW